MLRYLFILLPLIFLTAFTGCKEETIQPELFGSIRGQVLDQESGFPIPGAGISTNPPTSAVVSDGEGFFSINDIPVGNYAIIVIKNLYQKNTISVSVKDNQVTQAAIFMTKRTSNTPPGGPSNPFPANSSGDVPVNLELKWSASDTENDSLFYDVFLYKSNSSAPLLLKENHPDTFIVVDSLDYSTTYYWQVAAKDTAGGKTYGEIWQFTTAMFPNNSLFYTSFINNNYELFSNDSTGNQPVRLTSNGVKDWWPRVRPNSNQVAFVSNRNGENHIFISDLQGKNPVQVTNLPVAGFNNSGIGFCWSPDGYYLLYAHYDKLYRIRHDGSELILIATAPANRNFRECAWSPTNNKISALTVGINPYDSEIYLMNPDGSSMSLFVGNWPGNLGGLDFSVDGNKLLFTHDISGNEVPSGRELNASVILMSINQSDTVNISIEKQPGTNDFHPRFSPSGSAVIFTNAPNDNSQQPSVWLMDADGRNRRKILNNGLMPDWK